MAESISQAELAMRLGVPEGRLTYEGRQERKLNRSQRRKLARLTRRKVKGAQSP